MHDFLAIILIIVCMNTCSKIGRIAHSLEKQEDTKKYEVYERAIDALVDKNKIED